MENGRITRRDALRHELKMRLERRAKTENPSRSREPRYLDVLGRYAQHDPGMAALVSETARSQRKDKTDWPFSDEGAVGPGTKVKLLYSRAREIVTRKRT